MGNPHNESEEVGQVITEVKNKTKRPSLYKVILLNDDFTPMDFVISILKKFFHKSEAESARIMMEVHSQGAGIAGIYPFELAETKVYQVNEYSRAQRYPLKCIMELEE
ncbi:MAG: ATP-dependent Clp protease adapter ClpS [Bdellovibrionales bacterium]|nr:ATP-dependent Clp protease adapter ClpS [Bdellovibrionales bacterium]